mgnify:CR=1 FL=1
MAFRDSSLLAKLPAARKRAVTECAPTERVASEIEHEPVARVQLPIVAVPSEKVTLPLTAPAVEATAAVKVIVSSGYSSDPIMANFRSHGFCGCVAKPYRVRDLTQTLREHLTAR